VAGFVSAANESVRTAQSRDDTFCTVTTSPVTYIHSNFFFQNTSK